MSTLVILAHPARHRSRINRHLATVAQAVTNNVLDLYEAYPDFEIDVKQEQQRLLTADNIVLQHPFYWYSMPALLKEWIDLVFEHGFAYGNETQKLAGKILTQAVSAGGDAESYAPQGFNRFTMTELLRPLEATAHFCAMRWRQPFVTHGGHVITNAGIKAAGEDYRTWLTELTPKETNDGR